jgi:hypothetical protein
MGRIGDDLEGDDELRRAGSADARADADTDDTDTDTDIRTDSELARSVGPAFRLAVRLALRGWKARRVELLTIPDVAQALDIDVLAVHRLLKEGDLVEMRNASGIRSVPADFIQDGVVVKSLRSVISLLRDGRFTDAEIIDWLYAEDETLMQGTAIAALRANAGTEVKRRAQAAAL